MYDDVSILPSSTKVFNANQHNILIWLK